MSDMGGSGTQTGRRPQQSDSSSSSEQARGGDGRASDAASADLADLKAEFLADIERLRYPQRIKLPDGGEVVLPPPSAEELQGLLAYIEADTPGPLSAQTWLQRADFRADTAVYRATSANWETVLERPSDFRKHFHEVAAKPEVRAGSLNTLREQVMNDEDEHDVYQFPGGQTLLIEYLIRILDCAAGGFFLFTATAARAEFWETFLTAIMPFFLAGGQGVVVLPLSEVDERAYLKLLAQKASIESELGQAAATAGVRFIFINSFNNVVLDATNLFVACPGGRVVSVAMGTDLNAAAPLGIKGLHLPPGKSRAAAAKSIENLFIRSHPHDSPRGKKMIDDICEIYGHFGRQGWYAYAVPMLLGLATLRAEKTQEDLENKARPRTDLQALRIPGVNQREAEREAKKHWLAQIAALRGEPPPPQESVGDVPRLAAATARVEPKNRLAPRQDSTGTPSERQSGSSGDEGDEGDVSMLDDA